NTEGGLSHPTTKNDRVQIVDDDNDFTDDGKHSVAIQWINAGVFYGNCQEFEFYDQESCLFKMTFGIAGFQINTNTIHLYDTAIILSVTHPHSNIIFYYVILSNYFNDFDPEKCN
ncbi:MAG: hypothetical protein EZS28_054080, partial [Streblomastix strix]